MKPFVIKNSRGKKYVEFDGDYWIVYPRYLSFNVYPDDSLMINANAVEKNAFGLVNLLIKQVHEPDKILDRICRKSKEAGELIHEHRRQLQQLKQRVILHQDTNSSHVSEWTDYLYFYHDLKSGFRLEFSIFCQDILDDLDENSYLSDFNVMGESVYHTSTGIETFYELKEEMIFARNNLVRARWEIPDIDPLIEKYDNSELKENMVDTLRNYLNEIQNRNIHPNQIKIEFPDPLS